MSIIGEIITYERNNSVNDRGKCFSQLDLALKIGWENPSTLSRIESGKIIPNKDTVVRILRAIGTSQLKIISILIKSGYFYIESINHEYIDRIIHSTINPKISHLKYPINILVWDGITYSAHDVNDIGQSFFFGQGIYAKIRKFISEEHDLMELLFNPIYRMKKVILNWEDFVGMLVYNMHILYTDTRGEREYIAYLCRYPEFKELWEESKGKNINDYKEGIIDFVYKSPIVGITHLLIQKVNLFEDPRFFIEHFIPATAEDVSKIEELYKKYRM